ncbi:T6SS immunity protein Tdi1 domain-containing protein, partial [Pseudomonas syringae]
DEMYGFVPALMLGGPSSLDHLEKLKAVEHLMLLSQLAELQPYSF